MLNIVVGFVALVVCIVLVGLLSYTIGNYFQKDGYGQDPFSLKVITGFVFLFGPTSLLYAFYLILSPLCFWIGQHVISLFVH